MDALDAADPTTAGDGRAAAHGRRPVRRRRPRAARCGRRRGTCSTTRALTPRAHAALKAFVDDHHRRAAARRRPRAVSEIIEQVIEQVRLLRGPARGEVRGSGGAPREPRRARLRRARVRAARSRTPRSAASSIACRCCPRPTKSSGTQNARVWLMTMHAAKGLEFPVVIMAGLEEGPVPAQPRQRGRSRPRGGAAPLLRRHHPRRAAAVPVQRLTPPRLRRVPADRALAVPGARFRQALVTETRRRRSAAGSPRSPASGFRGAPYATPYPSARRGGTRRPAVHEEPPQVYRYEDEDQSAVTLRPGARVRHPQFGVGTVLSVEPGDDDTKLTVRFASVGQKRLLARFARLEPA